MCPETLLQNGGPPDASDPVLSISGLHNRQLVDLGLALARADQVERLVVAAVLFARDERVNGHDARLVLRRDKNVLLVGLLQEEEHVAARATPRGQRESEKCLRGFSPSRTQVHTKG